MGYRTIAQPVSATYIEKKSEFIAQLQPVQTAEEAITFLDSVRRAHRKARHNVYAYLVREQNTSRYSDDGEPQGTAGMPVLDVLQKNHLTDVCCVVTRYFGGILLGGGGLVRAYSHSTAMAVEAASILEMRRCIPLTLTMDYTMYGKVSYCLPQFEVIQTDSSFDTMVTLSILVQEPQALALQEHLIDLSNGTIQIQVGEAYDADFSAVCKP